VTDRADLVAVALGEAPADLVIKGGQLVDVYTGAVYRADVAIKGDRIAAVGDVDRCVGPDTEAVDAAGRYLAPGFIDTHIHVGASSLTMTELARFLVPKGTQVLVTDFTEAGKMRGKAAMRFFLDESARTPLKVYFSPFYTTFLGIEGRSSATLEELEEMLGWPETVELREWNVYAQRHPNERLRSLADLARRHGKLLNGHMEGQMGATLQASVAAGALSDHEAGTVEEGLARLRLGLALQVRFSSGGDDLKVLEAIGRHRIDSSNVMFSTDEEDVDDIARLGHIDHRVRRAVEMGVPPVDAIRMATLNAATYLRKTADVGSITPGRLAFVNLLSNLRDLEVTEVVAGSRVVARGGEYLERLQAPEYPESFHRTVVLKAPLTAADFRVPAPEGASGSVETLVIEARTFEVLTKAHREPLPVLDGAVTADPARGVAKVAVVERHFATGKVGKAFVRGLGVTAGAFGSSYHPGPVHIGVVGANDEDMAVVANRIAELQGGFVVAKGGRVVAEVPLPLLGFLSDRPAEVVVERFRAAKEAVRRELGAAPEGLFTTLAYLCMPGVLPEARISSDGPVLVHRGEKDLKVVPAQLFAQ
jgi:adenine deaminase